MISRVQPQQDDKILLPVEIYHFRDGDLSQRLEFGLQEKGFQSRCAEWPSLKVRKDTIYVLLDSGDDPILEDPEEDQFQKIRDILTQGQHVLWITIHRRSTLKETPAKGLITGLARVARLENQFLQLVTLEMHESQGNMDRELPRVVANVLSRSFSTSDLVSELEYSRKNGRLQIPRLMPADKVNRSINSIYSQSEPVSGLFHQRDRPLMLSVSKPGLLDTMIFVHDELSKMSLGQDELEIEAKAYGINFRDVLVALGQIKGSNRMAGECAGTITAVGSDLTSKFKIGERVLAWNGRPYASRPRFKVNYVHQIPSTMSYAVAASIPAAYITAYYSLVEIAKLSRGQKVLIHAASGGVGQAALSIAQNIGAEIFATVGNVAKRLVLTTAYGIPESHIFSSRAKTFKSGILRLTKGYGMDVILNSLSGDALQDTWDCIAMFGTFVEIGKTDIHCKGQINLGPFDKNVNFSSVDLALLADHRPHILKNVLAKVMLMFNNGSLKPMHPIRTMPMTEVEDAFRLIQARKHIGKVVLEANEDTTVRIVEAKPPELQLREDATYVVAGGLGSLGKKVIRFMSDHGARHLVILSRRHSNSNGQRCYETELGASRTKIRLMTCDITKLTSVNETIAHIQETMPPIKGVVQSAMLLQVSFKYCIFELL